MQADVVLTVSESKRLIAKGVVALPQVQRARRKGWLVVCTGTTNAYVAEELTAKPMLKPPFITGHTVPSGVDSSKLIPRPSVPDLVMKDGQVQEGVTKFEAFRQMQSGDVVVKGANALNYAQQVAGIAVGHPEGGTIGAAWGPMTSRKFELVIPVGLEKLVAHDILESWRKLCRLEERANEIPGLFPILGEIVTEIEALRLLTGVEALHVGSGGILGAEGGIRLLLEGSREEVDRALELVRTVQGEPSFGEQCATATRTLR